jgi:hypothetical protein
MVAQLSKELAEALNASGDKQLEVIDPTTNRIYVVVDSQTHREAMAALRRQQGHDAVAEGISQMEAGQGKPLHEVEAEMRAEFGYPPRA